MIMIQLRGMTKGLYEASKKLVRREGRFVQVCGSAITIPFL